MTQQQLGLYDTVVDEAALARTAARFAERRILLPTFAQLRDPGTIPPAITAALEGVGADDPHPLNLWRVHWNNARNRTGRAEVPEYLSLPGELTGVDATILIALGHCFPMIRAHKVLAAYACLAPRIVAGGFDPTRDRAIWPSTGNYARGGVAISRIMGCRGVAVLPEGMSRERFEWLEDWIAGPDDVIRTYGTESNVKEIYDACNELPKILERDHGGRFDAAAATHARYLAGADTEHVMELGEVGRRRIFNLGYYTWVEQQGVSMQAFEARRSQSWWDGLRSYTARWDEMITQFNERTGVSVY